MSLRIERRPDDIRSLFVWKTVSFFSSLLKNAWYLA